MLIALHDINTPKTNSTSVLKALEQYQIIT